MKKLAVFIASIVFVLSITVMPLVASAEEQPPIVKPCLSGIDISAGTLNKPFSSTVYKYTLYLDQTQDSTTITPVKAAPDLLLTINNEAIETNTFAIGNGKTKTICIKVASAGKKPQSRVYTVKIVRAKSTVNDLKELAVGAGQLEPAFDPAVTAYKLNLDEFTFKVTLGASVLNPLAKLLIDGRAAAQKTYALKQGETVTSKISVRAQTGAVKTYTVQITRAAASNPDKTGSLIEIAKRYMGKPYLRGAKGPDSFDCSGFVFYCLRSIGLEVKYMTSAVWPAASFATIASVGEMQPGDILCFQGHVGIYIGENMMIDCAPSGGGVRIANCTSPYWAAVFKCGKRVF